MLPLLDGFVAYAFGGPDRVKGPMFAAPLVQHAAPDPQWSGVPG